MRFCLMCLIAVAASAQSFDVATIKPSPPPDGVMAGAVGPSGGPGTSNPGLFTRSYCSLSSLLMQAWSLKRYQFSGPPSIDTERFQVRPKFLRERPQSNSSRCLQNLLSERFGLTFHHESKEMPVYSLLVGKNGLKMKISIPRAVAAATPDLPPAIFSETGQKFEMDNHGFPLLPKIAGRLVTVRFNGRARAQGTAVAMDTLATFLTSQNGGRPVLDATGLKGAYDFNLTWTLDTPITSQPGSFDTADLLPGLFAAVQEQLGLKVESEKASVDFLVIDQSERTPLEN